MSRNLRKWNESRRLRTRQDGNNTKQQSPNSAQEQDDAALREAMDQAPRKLRRVIKAVVRGARGQELGQMQQQVVTSPGEQVVVETAVMEEGSAAELSVRAAAGQEDPGSTNEAEEEQIQDAEVVEVATQQLPELVKMGSGQVVRSWFQLWRMGLLQEQQVERRWGLLGLQQFLTKAAALYAQGHAVSSQSDYAMESDLEAGSQEDCWKSTQVEQGLAEFGDSGGTEEKAGKDREADAAGEDVKGASIEGGGSCGDEAVQGSTENVESYQGDRPSQQENGDMNTNTNTEISVAALAEEEMPSNTSMASTRPLQHDQGP